MRTRFRKQPSIKTSRDRKTPTRVQALAAPLRILVPVDFSAESTSALKYAGAVAGNRRAEVILLHVVEWIHSVHDFGYGPVNRRRINNPAVRSASARLRALGRRHFASGLSWDTVVRSGAICQEIAKAASEMQSDMIVMPAHGRVRVEQARSGNVAARIMHLSPCPVLTLSKPLLARSRQAQAIL